MDDASPLARLLSGDYPKSEAQHYEAVGRFITAFANAEAAAHVLARKLTGLSDEMARMMLNGVRLGDLIDKIRSMMRIGKLDASTQTDIDDCLTQLCHIGDRRHRLVHRTSFFFDGALMVTNVMINKSPDASETDHFNEAELKNMESDARVIYLRLANISNPPSVPWDGTHLLHQPWRYKHVPPKTPNQKPRATPEAPRTRPGASRT